MFFVVLYIVLAIIRPQEYPDSFAEGLPILPVVLALAVISWAISARKAFSEPEYPLLFAFFVVVMISEVAAGWSGGALVQASLFGPAVAIFVLVAQMATTHKRVVVLMTALVLCSCVLALHGVEQKQAGIGWTGMPLVQEDGRIQYIGIFSDPNDLGLLFVSVLPMAFYLSARGGFLGLARILWLAAAALLLYGVYLTNSRGALLGVAAIVGIWLWMKRGIVTALVVGGAGLAAMTLLPSRLQELDASEESAAGRVDAWYQGFQMLGQHPIFGVGAGQFTEHNYLTAHNSFMLALAETGLVGFTLWFSFVVYLFRMMLAIYRHEPDFSAAALDEGEDAQTTWSRERTIAATLLLAICGLFTCAFFLSRTYVVVLYMVAGLVVGEYANARRRFPSLPTFSIQQDLWRLPLMSLGAVIALYVLTKVLL